MKDKLVNIHLKVERSEESLVAHILFTNDSNEEVYLDKQTICLENKTHRSVFKIINEKRDKVHYKGVLVRRDVLPEDFIVLKVGDKIETEVVLNEVYEMAKNHKYSIQYSVFHPTYLDDAGFTILESNTIDVLY
ncbi:hypothetical protein A4D02_05010 [Niastella koreensis]|uniref:Uncharacterized protein n=2 Tax=Niastella koreensis TaxID=354356 RepID=G8T7T8_NIAKG|nr:hypothetical protein [Niastella koreensis]AEW03382.1 hypothetical protein Niako_7165 [Niastella koreensis GR20-10]OQP55663.1 hypothetical protein A4D02_05010 [Niastella koreensis]